MPAWTLLEKFVEDGEYPGISPHSQRNIGDADLLAAERDAEKISSFVKREIH